MHDCYCANEIYSFDGFGYQLFYEDQECEKLGEIPTTEGRFVVCVAYPFNDETRKPSIILFTIDSAEDKCVDALRYDATDNNVNITKIMIEKQSLDVLEEQHLKFDLYNKEAMLKSLKQIMSLCNGVVMID